MNKLNILDIPQDADTLVTSLKFLFPLLSPICILFWCSDISVYIKKLFICRTYDPPCVIGQSANRCKGELEIFSLVALQQLHTMCKVEADFDFSDFLSKSSFVTKWWRVIWNFYLHCFKKLQTVITPCRGVSKNSGAAEKSVGKQKNAWMKKSSQKNIRKKNLLLFRRNMVTKLC